MKVTVEVITPAPRDAVWAVVTDIEGAAETLSGVEQVEVLERPGPGLLGLRWRETRTIMGKRATETMWITSVDEGSSYATEARSHGSEYRTVVRVDDAPGGGTRLAMDFGAEATTPVAKVMAWLLAPVMRRSVATLLRKDLEELAAAAAARAS
jgi:hypothetical protein